MTARRMHEELKNFASTLADAAGSLIRAGYDAAGSGRAKSDGSPVTAIDGAVEDRLRAMIMDTYPAHGIIGEEREAHAPESELVWVIDPIDGTLPFLAGFPVFGTLIALAEGGLPVLGIADFPMAAQRWSGARGRRTEHNGASVSTRPCDALVNALLATSNPDFYSHTELPAFERMRACSRWNIYGGSCLAYAQLASGRIDVGMDAGFEPCDYLALVPIIEGAGGLITDWTGRALHIHSGGCFIAAGDARVHAQSLEIIAGKREPHSRANRQRKPKHAKRN